MLPITSASLLFGTPYHYSFTSLWGPTPNQFKKVAGSNALLSHCKVPVGKKAYRCGISNKMQQHSLKQQLFVSKDCASDPFNLGWPKRGKCDFEQEFNLTDLPKVKTLVKTQMKKTNWSLSSRTNPYCNGSVTTTAADALTPSPTVPPELTLPQYLLYCQYH